MWPQRSANGTVSERGRDLGLEVLLVSWFEWHSESWRSRKREVGLLHLQTEKKRGVIFIGFVAFYVHSGSRFW